MKHICWRVVLLSFGLILSAAAFGQGPKSYPNGHGGEVFFPVGDISFADELVSFTSGEPKARAEKYRIPEETLGIPDYVEVESANYLTLGCGGVLVVRFTDNSLTDIDGPDLYVFEVGPRSSRRTSPSRGTVRAGSKSGASLAAVPKSISRNSSTAPNRILMCA